MVEKYSQENYGHRNAMCSNFKELGFGWNPPALAAAAAAAAAAATAAAAAHFNIL